MTSRTQGPIPTAEPRQRTVSHRSLVNALAGAEQPYPVYNFSGRPKFERPNYAPFPDPE
jgi:hypothetical protein